MDKKPIKLEQVELITEEVSKDYLKLISNVDKKVDSQETRIKALEEVDTKLNQLNSKFEGIL